MPQDTPTIFGPLALGAGPTILSYNSGQNYVDTSLRKAFLSINRTPTPALPPNNVDAMTFISTCLHNIFEHNIVKGDRGIKERTVKFTFLFKKLVKSYCPHSFWPGL